MSLALTSNRRGFILLPVLAALALIGLCAFMLNRSGGLERRITASQATAIQARYIAEAGMNHAKWFLSFDCGYRAALVDIPFGAGHSYGVTLTDNADGTIRLLATGVSNGQSPDTSTHFSEIRMDDYLCEELEQKSIYWTDWGLRNIHRAEFDGSGIKTILSGSNGLILPKPLAINQDTSKMYWGENNVIYRAEVDGAFMGQVVDCATCEVTGIDIDQVNEFLYYTDKVNNTVSRTDLDGNNNTVLINSLINNPSSIRVDPVKWRFYFSDGGNLEIKSAKLDGTNLNTIKTGVQAWSLALDPVEQHIYYFDRNTRSIDRIDYGGGGLVNLITFGGGIEINGIDLHLSESRMYWSRTDDRRLQRANLDGTGIEDIVVEIGGSKVWDIRIGPAEPVTLPRTKGPHWTEDQGANKKVVRRAELDGTNTQYLVSGQKTAMYLKFDNLSERLYWAGEKGIMSSTVKGADLSVVLDCNAAACSEAFGLALDPVNQQIYFVDMGNKKIYRIDYDGSNETELVTGLNKPWDIDLDLGGGKMYWVDEGTKTLSRANLDGSSLETVLDFAGGDTEVEQPISIAVDSDNAALYWFNKKNKTIYRSSLTGAGATAIIGPAEVQEALALDLDLDDGKIYWSDKSLKQIKRANLNGTSPEVAVDITADSNKVPWGIVIVPPSL